MFEFFPDNRGWSFTCLRLLAESYYGGGEFNECYRTISRITPGDRESWHQEWLATGERIAEIARTEQQSGHLIAARKAYFRASNYYRVAEFFLSHRDERKISTYLKSVSFFQTAARLAGGIEVIEVPYEDTAMPGYLVHPVQPTQNPPVLIFMGGADSTAEEIYFIACREALLRGIACAIVDGPGRGGMLRLQKVQAIPDYEKPTGAIIDFLEARDDVDSRRVALLGVSMGRYYVARAAACDKRVKACVVHYGCYDVLTDIYEHYPPIQDQMRWLVGADSDQEARRALAEFTLKGRLEQIECPLLIIHGEDDLIIDPQGAQRIYDEAKCEKELRIFKSGEPGSNHCGYDNQAEIFPFIHDWIHDRVAG